MSSWNLRTVTRMQLIELIKVYLFIYIDTNNSGLKVPGHY